MQLILHIAYKWMINILNIFYINVYSSINSLIVLMLLQLLMQYLGFQGLIYGVLTWGARIFYFDEL